MANALKTIAFYTKDSLRWVFGSKLIRETSEMITMGLTRRDQKASI